MAKTINEQLKEKDAEIKRLRKALELEKCPENQNVVLQIK